MILFLRKTFFPKAMGIGVSQGTIGKVVGRGKEHKRYTSGQMPFSKG